MTSGSDRIAAKVDELSKLIDQVAARTPGSDTDRSPEPAHRQSKSAGRRRDMESGEQGESNPESVESQRAKARETALRRLDRRDYSRAEMIDYLVRKREVDPAIAAEIIDRFVEVGIVDDDRFARNWASERIRTRKLSRNAIKRELNHKGVGAEAIDTAIDQISADDEREAALTLCRAKVSRFRDVDRQVALRRLSAQLARRGYSTGLAVSVVLQVLDEQAAFLED